MVSFTRRLKGDVFRRVIERRPRLSIAVRYLQFLYWRTQVRLNRIIRTGAEDPDRLIYVNPCIIRSYIGGLSWSRYSMRGRVEGGDWDLQARPFDPWDVNRALQARFEKGSEWESTALYQRVSAEIANGSVRWGCATMDEFLNRLDGLDRLFCEIREHGFRTQKEMGARDDHSWEFDSPFKPFDEVTVCIDRAGHILLRDGKHRLSIAKILGLSTIPVAVGLRHRHWVNFKQELENWISSQGGKAYQPFTHPDLAHFPHQHDDNRFDLISDALALNSGRVLDIGAYFGYFCHRFQHAGFQCTAYETHPKHLYFMRQLREAEYRTFEIRPQSILDTSGKLDYDVVLALNIFHHFIKTAPLLEKLSSLLGRIDAHSMFFEPHCPDDSIMQGSHVNFTPDEFVRFVLDHSVFNNVRQLGVAARGRPLYMLTR